ncbi:DUF2971 domain-containing protein [Thalassovita sp.]|uniref:DUF2971 domain-containing protein n=1 Tax=Thalassovita sp. TaxID=1979401 RepID=UPI002B278BF9|nr:DUF2971 domain-containing protein [Thalassovita sp.]
MIDIHPELPEVLFKYTSEAGLLSILRNKSLRFSRPTRFNDLYDAKLQLSAGYDREAVISGALEKLYASISGEDQTPLVGSMGALIESMRPKFSEDSDKEQLFAELRLGLEESLDNLPDLLKKYEPEFEAHFQLSKILCLSSDGYSPPMWGNYADNLKGAAVGFTPTVEADSLFLTAKPIRYLDKRPALLDEEPLIEQLSARSKNDPDEISERIVFTKAMAWQYEAEWRIVAGHGWKPESETEQVQFHIGDLRYIVLGTRFDLEKVAEVKELMATFPNARLMYLSDDYSFIEA